MDKLTYFILGFLTCLLPFCCIIAIDFHISNFEIPEPEIIFEEKINYSEPEKFEEVVTFEQTSVFEKTNSTIDKDLHSILQSHNFDSWSKEEKVLLCHMMQAIARGEQIDVVSFNKASDRVLETFLDLLENAGYK